MKPVRIYYTPEFEKQWKKIPPPVKRKAIQKEQLFRENSYHPSLKTHKLSGVFEGLYAFSIDYHWRIVFQIQGAVVYFVSVGTHAIYRK